jgi:hypothetical protein
MSNDIASLVLFACAVSFVLLANFLLYAMIGRINVRIPADQRIGYFWFDFGKNVKILREYWRLYPDGSLHLLAVGSFCIGMALLLAFAWQFGFFHFNNIKR